MGIYSFYHDSNNSNKNDINIDEICEYTTSSQCNGNAKEYLERACLENSVEVRVSGRNYYEVSAKANDPTKCFICVTESTAWKSTKEEITGTCSYGTICSHTKEKQGKTGEK